MKQVLQNYKTGELRLAEVPPPALRPQGVLIATRASLISAGTEKMKVDVAKKNLLGKALERPDQVKKVLDSVRQQGLLPTWEKVMNKLDTPTPLGYSSAGIVLDVGRDASEFHAGDRVACAGAGYAVHADIAYVPKNLVVPMASTTPFDHAAFTTLGAIALQGVRQGDIRLGEDVVVIGLGLVGLLTVQLLKESGAHVVGIELDASRAALAKQLGCDHVVIGGAAEAKEVVRGVTGGRGADAVLVTAASASSGPVELAGELCRDRGRVIVVGITKMDLPHRVYYDKELSLVLSRSYGPGRYDPSYEERGIDYPLGYVRWTERRNMAEFLRLVESDRVRVEPLISHRVPFDEAERAYGLITGEKTEPYLGIVLTYADRPPVPGRVVLDAAKAAPRAGRTRTSGEPVGIGFLGAGNFATSMLLPHLKSRSDVKLTGVVTASGLTARGAAEKFGFGFCASNAEEILGDAATDAVFVVTRHHLHADYAARALEAGKSVFVEKPLATTAAELERVVAAAEAAGSIDAASGAPLLLVGFNRRFAPLTAKLAAHFPPGQAPLVITYRVNAGYLGRESWYQDAGEGGGRILGEVCHFLDYVSFLAGSPIVRVYAAGVRDPNGHWRADDNLSVTASCADGSVGTVLYAASGDATMPKERVEVMGRGRSAVLDNFRELSLWSANRRQVHRAMSVDKGHAAEVTAWVESLRKGGPSPIDPRALFNVSWATLATVESLATGEAVPVRI